MSLSNNAWIWGEIQSILSKSNKTYDAIVVLGPSGIGKTYQMDILAKTNSYDAYWIHSSNCTNSKELRDMIVKGMKTSLIANLAQVQSSKVVIIDELDVMFQLDRTMASALSDMIGEHKTSKGTMILLGNSSIEKKVASLKGNLKVFHCCMPSDADMFLWCKERAPKGMKKTHIMEIAEAANGNPGQALQLLSTKHLVASFSSMKSQTNAKDQLRARLLDDPWLFPLRCHENLIKELAKRKGTKSQKESKYHNILKTLCEWDLMLSNGVEPMIAVEGLCSSLHLNLLDTETKKGATNDVAIDEFTKVFSNLSLQKKQERNLYAKDTQFPWMHAQVFCDYKHYK